MIRINSWKPTAKCFRTAVNKSDSDIPNLFRIPLNKGEAEENLSFNGCLLYSRYAPRKRAEQIADAFSPHRETLYLLPSPLLGYGVSEIKRKCACEQVPLLILECHPFLFSKTDEPDCLFFDTGQFEHSFSEIRKQLKTLFSENRRLRKALIVPLNEGYRIRKKEYDTIIFEIQKEIDFYWKNRSTIIYFKDLWIRNLFRNLSRHSFTDISLKKESCSYVVCGAGESLEDSVDFLREKRNYLRIMAADTALPVLLKKGITPDYVVVLESQTANVSDFLHGTPPDNIIYITEITSAPAANRYFRKTKWIRTGFTDTQLFRRLPVPLSSFPQTGSVGIAALYTAMQLTDGEIYITGLDFSFFPGKTHSRGTDVHERLLNRLNRFESIESAYSPAKQTAQSLCGRRTVVSESLLNYASLIQNEAKQMKNVYDCRTVGLPLGLPKKNLNEIRLSESPLSPLNSNYRPDLSRVGAFIQNEYKILKKADSEITKGEISKETAEEIDYLHYFFPDYTTENISKDHYIGRLFFYIKKFERLSEKISRHPI